MPNDFYETNLLPFLLAFLDIQPFLNSSSTEAVLVFVLTNFLYCNKVGGTEMCFSDAKFVSLFTVTGGVLGYGYATQLTTLTTKKDVVDVDDGKGKIATISEITGLL